MTSRFALPVLVTLCMLALLTPAGGRAQAVEARAPAREPQKAAALRCAVDSTIRGLTPKSLCEQLGQSLKRPTQLVPDARKETKGDAVQIMHDDVQWTLVVLRGGAVRSWTRISVSDARGREVLFFARALRSLLQTEPKAPNTCVRLEPKSTRSAAFDLVYPWAELKPCEPRVVEVPDPWWGDAR